MSFDNPETLLHTFLSVARNIRTIEKPVLECGVEQWTYGDLDIISSALALEFHAQFGDQPTVASLHENHPYILAILLATWKLGGIFAPLDPHAPPEMVAQMLANLHPTCVVVAADNDALKALTNRMQIAIVMFDPKNSTMTHLTQRYMHHAPDAPQILDLLPSSSSLALYLHTSSASSISNLKCVPISHDVLAQGSRSRLRWFRRTWPEVWFDELRVMGWTSWSHIMGISHDLGAATFGTGGCYVFGILPSGYSAQDFLSPGEGKLVNGLLDGALRIRPDVLIGVPWLLEGIKDIYARLLLDNSEESSQEANRIKETFKELKYLGLGGATTTKEALHWATNLGIKIVQDLGMTELGRPLFHSKVTNNDNEGEGWALEDCLIDDAEFTLIDDNGKSNLSEGELIITSSTVNTNGYLKYDNSTFFQRADGKTTLRTGDIYVRASGNRLVWKGRKEDYIQMTTSETLDPRPIEKALKACPAIADCSVVGNNFLRKPSDFICVILRPSSSSPNASSNITKITEALAAVNRTLIPPLRIPWSRVLLLDEDQIIPYTKKGTVFRKKLEDSFGALLASHLSAELNGASRDSAKTRSLNSVRLPPRAQQGPEMINKEWRREEIEQLVIGTIADVLGVALDALNVNRDLSFAEFGMDSDMAVRIVNKLNNLFALRLPLNTCHTFIDLTELVQAILRELGVVDKQIYRHLSGTLLPSQDTETDTTIVIVGQAFRLPGAINTPESFWEALVNKRDDIITHVPADRWDHQSFYRAPSSSEPARSCDITFEKAGFVDVAHYDNNFFEISAPEALFISPAIRLILETTFEALENACIPVSKLRGTNMGVFVGTGTDVGYHELMYMEKGFETFTRFYGTGMAASTACGRLSYLLDIHGPSITVDTACSSGLVAFDQGVKYLQSGRGDSAIVSAVSTNICFLSAQKMTSPNSRCATFTDQADGYVPSEGCVSLILKTKAAALCNGDNILAVVKSSEVMHGGKSQGLVAPNVHTQIGLQRQLFARSGLRPIDVDFLEAHGTGTALGDLIEIQGINEVFKGSHRQHPLIVGAAKTSVGHTEFAAGLVGVVKTIASFKYGAVPGLMHLTDTNMNPSLDINTVPLFIPHETVSLPPKDDSYRGLVLANGFAGTVAGTILEDPKSLNVANDIQQSDAIRDGESPMLFVVSAKTIKALEDYIQKYIGFCINAPPSLFREICYSSCVGREHYRYRFSCVVFNLNDLVSGLEQHLREFSLHHHKAPARRVAFAFPGQGSHTQFRAIVTSSAAIASELLGYPILSLLLGDIPGSVEGDSGQYAQVCIFVYQYSISTWLKRLGICPSGVLGHSLGEISAAVIAGAMSYELGLKLVIHRAAILKSNANQPGTMAVVAASQETIVQLFHQLNLESQLVIAVYNGAQSHVISGDLAAIDSFLVVAKLNGLRATKVNVSQAFHSPMIHSALPLLQKWISEQISSSRLEVPLFSTAYGKEIPNNSSLSPDYWIAHARDPVRFSDAVQALVTNKNIDVILDIGPQPFIWTSLQGHSHNMLSIATTTKPSNDQTFTFLDAISLLFKSGVTLDFTKLFSGCGLRKTSIPTYPFQRRRHFPTCIPSRGKDTSTHLSSKHLAPMCHDLHFPVDPALFALLDDHLIEGHKVIPGAALVDFFALRSQFKSLKSIVFHSPMVIESSHEQTSGEFDQSTGSFSLSSAVDSSLSKGGKVCSGLTALYPMVVSKKDVDETTSYESIRDNAEVYSSFKGVAFGLSFRNIQELRMWSTHADALVTVEPTEYPIGDRIRKLDCCLHSFGAVMHTHVLEAHLENGAFLPASLEGFTLHSDELPRTFICRYHLPLEVTRNSHVISAAFEVLSLSGKLLVSCAKYSVAWLPTGAVIQNAEVSREDKRQRWFQQSWVAHSNPEEPPTMARFIKYNQLLCVGYLESRLSRIISAYGNETLFLNLQEDINEDLPSASNVDNLSSLASRFDALFSERGATALAIILDLTGIQSNSSFPTSVQCAHHVLELMQLIMRRKITISNFLLISEMSVSVESDICIGDGSRPAPSVAALVQGMLRVYRRETTLDTQVWALDLPLLDEVDELAISEILLNELSSRQRGATVDRVVAYRMESDCRMKRVVPVLLPMDHQGEFGELCAGVSLIIGLGSIGYALASFLVAKGGGKVIFIGRRHSRDTEIQDMMSRLQSETNGRCFYIQADVNDLDSVRSVMLDIQVRYGSIQNIIHTAAIVRDAAIQNVDTESFNAVLAPKVTGSWNLHLASEEICPSLKSFVLLSSISVPLGNPGQVAYVAGNHYLEVLASYRRSRSLPATCIQLGAWESRLTDNMDDAVHNPEYLMDNRTGIPLIVNAMVSPQTVQVVASFPLDSLATNPAFTFDPLFREILPKGFGPPILDSGIQEGPLVNAYNELLGILRTVLELGPNEKLEVTNSLTACGIDSIAFAQVRGKCMPHLGVEVPTKFLSDSFTIHEMLTFVAESYSALHRHGPR